MTASDQTTEAQLSSATLQQADLLGLGGVSMQAVRDYPASVELGNCLPTFSSQYMLGLASHSDGHENGFMQCATDYHKSEHGLDYQHDFSREHTASSSGHHFELLNHNEHVCIPRQCSKEEWNKIKPDFMLLYAKTSFKLRDIKIFMCWNYDFHASTSMYKSRIKRWELCRNLKTAEKDNLIESPLSDQMSGALISTANIRKALRHAGKQDSDRKARLQAILRIKEKCCENSSYIWLQDNPLRKASSAFMLGHGGGIGILDGQSDSERILQLVRNSYLSLSPTKSSCELYGCICCSCALDRELDRGIHKLSYKAYRESGAHFAHAGNLVISILKNFDRSRMLKLLSWFTPVAWSGSEILQSYRDKFMAYVTREVSFQHISPYLTNLTTHCQAGHMTNTVLERICCMLLNVVQELNVPTTERDADVLHSNRSLYRVQSWTGQYHKLIDTYSNGLYDNERTPRSRVQLLLSSYCARAQASLGNIADAVKTDKIAYYQALNPEDSLLAWLLAENLPAVYKSVENYDAALDWTWKALTVARSGSQLKGMVTFCKAFDTCSEIRDWPPVRRFLLLARGRYQLMVHSTDDKEAYCLGCLRNFHGLDVDASPGKCSQHPCYDLDFLD